MRKQSTVGLFLLVLFFVGTKQSCLGGNSTLGCIEREKQALLRFKQSLTDPLHLLSSWNNTDCCTWNGVFCDGTTGHVVKLDLRNNISYSSSINQLQAREVNSSLVELKYLNYLDLSGNDFQDSPIPNFFGSMKQLRYLNLSTAGFSGAVPHHLGNLSRLQCLDLHNQLLLSVDDLSWVTRLSSLQRLDMSRVDLSEARNLINVLNMLPLLEVRLSGCGLQNIHLSDHAYVNSTLSNLQYLDLSFNSFEGKLPHLLQNMTSLRTLDLSVNHFNSSVPLFVGNIKSLVLLNLARNGFNHISGGLSMILLNQCHMKSLDLSDNRVQGEMTRPDGNFSECVAYDLKTLSLNGNEFSGPLPDWLEQFNSLKQLDLSGNLFNGSIPESLGKLSELRELDLSGNQWTGGIPTSVGTLTSLEVLKLSNIRLTGEIPAWVWKLTALRELDLSDNQLNGAIPVSLGQLSKLERIDISSNSLKGVLSEAHFANLSMLEYISTSSNLLAFKIRSDWMPPFQLKSMLVGSCKVGPQFPPWLRTQKEIETLELFNASISGTLPMWLRDMPLYELDLSNNLISGPLPHNIGDMMPTLENLLLAGNLLNGSIPNSLCKMNLVIVDLSRNRLTGNLPSCWKDIREPMVIKLASNRLSGVIPSLCGNISSSLEWLHLNNNSFSGELPLGLRNCTNLIVLDLGENGFSGHIPKWIGDDLTALKILRLHKNRLNDSIPLQLCNLGLQIMDLAHNNLTGTIPRCFGNLTGMVLPEVLTKFCALNGIEDNMEVVMRGAEREYTTNLLLVVNMDLSSNKLVGKIPEELTVLSGLLGLNLSNNHLTGGIPTKIGDMKSLISLDLSSNNLSSMIPNSMAALTSLSHLNLSYNNFSGQIPTGHQLQTLDDPSIYSGNSELCGFPLPKKCPGDESSKEPTTTTSHEEKDDDEDKSKNVWFYIDIMSGFATGFWGVVGILIFKKSWRHAYFRFLYMTKDKMLVAIEVRVSKLKMRRNHIDE